MGTRVIDSLRQSLKAQGPDSQCGFDFDLFLDGYENGELWALQMFDSSTKIPSGLLTGSLVDYGNYDECLAVRSKSVPEFHGQHCLTNINSSFGLLRWSYCVPSSCPSAFVESLVQNVLTLGPILGVNSTVSVTVNPSDCHSEDAKVPWEPADWFAVALIVFFLVLVLGSTVYDWCLKQTGRHRDSIFLAFSLLTNGSKILSTKTGSETLSALSGIRVLSIFWIILGHRYFYMSMSAVLNKAAVSQIVDQVKYEFIIGANNSVDSFFFLSGLLNSFNVLKTLDQTKVFPFFKYYVHRYLRTTPALAFIVLMYATWYIHLADGPVWFTYAEPSKQFCVDNWWQTLLYINNYYPSLSQCAGHSWYLAVDMQLFWLSPLIIYPLWRTPKLGRILMGFVFVISVIVPFVVSYVYEIRAPFPVDITDENEYNKLTALQYVPTHMRATPYIMGIALGYLLNKMRDKNIRLRLNKVFVWIFWILSISLLFSCIFGVFPFLEHRSLHPYNKLQSSFYISLHRVAWGLALSWIIMACQYGYGGPINTFLSWKIFTPLSKISYSMYLCHLAIISYQIGRARTVDYFSDFNQFHRFFGDVGFTIICSTLLCLVFESPIVVLQKKLLTLRSNRPNPPPEGGSVNIAFTSDEKTV